MGEIFFLALAAQQAICRIVRDYKECMISMRDRKWITRGRILKRSLKIPSLQGALTTRSNYKENWYAKTSPYEEGALKWYAKDFLRDVQGWIVSGVAKCFFHN